MSLEHLTRAKLVKLEVDQLVFEARRCEDLERLRAIQAEIVVRNDALADIYREMLMEDLERYRPKPKRSLWRRWCAWWSAAISRKAK